jgi:hypothetical protein
VSDTPRTDANRQHFFSSISGLRDPSRDYVEIEFARQIERELNVANDRIKRLEAGDAALTYSIGLDLQKENDVLKDRIKRLEEAGDLMVQHFYTDEPRSEMWEKAKEAKP